ncbi:MAG: hypothetical protein Q7R95_11130, partial [bacterium]|nr:hypothetical protein [bacterium]
KDYVDLYFILKDRCTIQDVIKKSIELFGKEFNEKIFRTQLAYYHDIDYSEQVEYLHGFEIEDALIKEYLIEMSVS